VAEAVTGRPKVYLLDVETISDTEQHTIKPETSEAIKLRQQ